MTHPKINKLLRSQATSDLPTEAMTAIEQITNQSIQTACLNWRDDGHLVDFQTYLEINQ